MTTFSFRAFNFDAWRDRAKLFHDGWRVANYAMDSEIAQLEIAHDACKNREALAHMARQALDTAWKNRPPRHAQRQGRRQGS
jgi:hypothetical protein